MEESARSGMNGEKGGRERGASKKARNGRPKGSQCSISGAGQPLEAGRGFCTGVCRRLPTKAVWCHGERGKTRKEEKKPKEFGEVRRNTKRPEGMEGPPYREVPSPSVPLDTETKALLFPIPVSARVFPSALDLMLAPALTAKALIVSWPFPVHAYSGEDVNVTYMISHG
ncbi:hypothetical protein KM043_002030 [Ampulex compressa]|nr:hypothetical protein KM043_002030 [Ampulex compressa]